MIYKIFSVYDSKVEAYLQPFFSPSNGAALRAFTDIVNDPNSQFSKHPEDYTLFVIGEYNDETAKISSLSALQSLGLALEFKNSEKRLTGVKQL